MLMISNHDVEQLLDARETIAALDGAYRDLARGDAVCRPRIDVAMPTGEGSGVYQWGTMEGGSSRSGYFAIRLKSDVVTEVEYGGTRTQEKFCVTPGTFCGLVLLFSVRNGEPLAILNDGVLQHMRVGADSAIGTRLMARDGATRVGMIGSGGMARSHLEALLAVAPIEAVRVYSPTPAHREGYAKEMEAQHGIEVIAVEDPRAACRGADVVCGCTDAIGEVIDGDWLEPGTHVTCVGGRLSASAVARVARWLRLGDAPAPVNVPEWGTAAEMVTYRAQPDSEIWGEHHVKNGAGRGLRGVGDDQLVYLADLLANKAKGRRDDDEVTFSERGNIQGAQFFAVAGRVYELARERGLGQEVPTELFLQDIRD